MAEVTESMIADLVHRFYARARADPAIGPLFERFVVDWDAHEALIQDFWSHALLRTGRYKGLPYLAHVNRSIRPEHFEQWLAPFREVAHDVLPAPAAQQAVQRAEFMAEGFRAGLFPFERPGSPRSGH
jgi:hemoglobin